MRTALSVIFLAAASVVVFQMAIMYEESVPEGEIGWFFTRPDCKEAVETTPAFFITIIALICIVLSHISCEQPYFSWARFIWGLVYLGLAFLLVVSQFTAFRESGCADEISFLAKILIAGVTLVCIGAALMWLESKLFTVVFFLLAIALMAWLTATFGAKGEELSFAGYFYQTLYVGALLAGGISGLFSFSIQEAARGITKTER